MKQVEVIDLKKVEIFDLVGITGEEAINILGDPVKFEQFGDETYSFRYFDDSGRMLYLTHIKGRVIQVGIYDADRSKLERFVNRYLDNKKVIEPGLFEHVGRLIRTMDSGTVFQFLDDSYFEPKDSGGIEVIPLKDLLNANKTGIGILNPSAI